MKALVEFTYTYEIDNADKSKDELINEAWQTHIERLKKAKYGVDHAEVTYID